MNSKIEIDVRKKDHLDLANKAQTSAHLRDGRFDYEPLLSAHPSDGESVETTFLGKKLGAPLWISSMTGGTDKARSINRNLAHVAHKYSLGMALGSCRPLLDSMEYFEDFNLRPLLGEGLPFYANLGIAQVESLLRDGEINRIHDLVFKLRADGLIIHLNPLQEWLQMEGDRFRRPPLETILEFCEEKKYPLIVKEVGQGMGRRSLKALWDSPVDAIEFAAFGGTNFSKLEAMRSQDIVKHEQMAMSCVGHTALEMVDMANSFYKERHNSPEIIISGGIRHFLDGHFLMEKYHGKSIYGQAKAFLSYADKGPDSLEKYVKGQLEGLMMAKSFFKVKRELL